jgi:hypothetical protein
MLIFLFKVLNFVYYFAIIAILLCFSLADFFKEENDKYNG